MTSPVSDIERRSKVWTALAELFVARELQDYDYRSIAETLRASALTSSDVLDILRDEVAPTFMANLSGFNPVPEMEGWPEDQVREKVLAVLSGSHGIARRLLSPFRGDPLQNPVLQARWQAVLRLLSTM
jgi:hypothetical protein